MRFMVWMLALTFAVSPSVAFGVDKATVDLPFNFESHGKAFPAGQYDVISSMNRNFLTIVNRTDPAANSLWVVTPVSLNPNDAALLIQFDRIGNMPELHTVRLGSYTTSALDRQSSVKISSRITTQGGR
jgi:acetoacetate decarboxylase